MATLQAKTFTRQKNFLAALAQWDILVLPSYEEGLSMVIPEAMTQGAIVVASDVGGAKEYINDGENRFIFNHGDQTSLMAILEHITNTPNSIIEMRKNLRDFLL